ncbi:Hsp20/alpha crystallin family protein [Paracandidimonas soli]|nr:Hsp20/alpha crystallin family protein [Paracandidimonas soli]
MSFQRDMNRLFDDMFRSFDLAAPSDVFTPAFTGNWPRLEVTDGDKALQVTAELPGLEEKDVELLLEDGVLTIRGEKQAEKQDDAKQFSERFYGRFERRLRLGYDIDEENVKASFKNGVLTIDLPKDQSAGSRVKRIALNQ